jgi:hypothetical protein
MYVIIKYINNYDKKDFFISFLTQNISSALKKAYNMSFYEYGEFTEDIYNINYSGTRCWDLKSLAEYSDWTSNIDGVYNNIVFAVIQIEYPLSLKNYDIFKHY